METIVNMHNTFDTGSSDWKENSDRLEILYKQSHTKLLGAAYNTCKDRDIAEDLVGDVYIYLGERINKNLYWKDSFNLFYCIRFIQTRWINKVKRDKKIVYSGTYEEVIIGDEHDEERDERMQRAYERVLEECDKIKRTDKWVSEKLYSLYWITDSDETLAGLSKKIGISPSTSFKHIKLMKEHLKNTIQNPFL